MKQATSSEVVNLVVGQTSVLIFFFFFVRGGLHMGAIWYANDLFKGLNFKLFYVHIRTLNFGPLDR